MLFSPESTVYKLLGTINHGDDAPNLFNKTVLLVSAPVSKLNVTVAALASVPAAAGIVTESTFDAG